MFSTVGVDSGFIVVSVICKSKINTFAVWYDF